MVTDNIDFPKDTPEWLKELLATFNTTIQDSILKTDPDKFLEVRGKVALYKQILEEIDFIGKKELERNKQIQIAATIRR